MDRLTKFRSLREHLVIGKAFKKLSQEEVKLCEQFIEDNKDLDKNAFAEKANRWYLDKPNKPKHIVDMWALVTQSL